MSREELHNDILAYADGELTGERAAAVEQAMADSAEVRAEVEQWRQLRQAAQRALFAGDAPRDMQRRIAAQIDALKPKQKKTQAPLIIRLYQPMMAAAAAIVIAFGFYFLGPSAQNEALADPGQFPNRHMICVDSANFADTLKINGMAPQTAHALISQQYDFPVLVPDLSSVGWTLQAGRQCGIRCGTEGSPTARMVHVFYTSQDDPKKSISLFSVERRVAFYSCSQVKGCGGNRLYSETSRQVGNGKFAVISWCEPKNTYAACGTMTPAELRGVLEDVRVAIADNRMTTLLAAAQ